MCKTWYFAEKIKTKPNTKMNRIDYWYLGSYRSILAVYYSNKMSRPTLSMYSVYWGKSYIYKLVDEGNKAWLQKNVQQFFKFAILQAYRFIHLLMQIANELHFYLVK